MTNHVKNDYYILRKAKLLKGFDKVAKRATKFLVNHYGDDFASIIISETREKFEQIIPEIPYIGGNGNLIPTNIMIINGWIIPFFQVMKAHGKTSKEVITICYEVSDDYMKSIPRILLWLLGKLAFWKLILRIIKKHATQSHKRRYPGDFVYTVDTVAEADGKDFDWALELTECAVNKFYDVQGVEELKPYCNFFDVTYSRYLNMGLDARTTIGSGCQICKLQYKKGRETQVPEPLKGIIPEKIYNTSK
jgi:hypothetical protein